MKGVEDFSDLIPPDGPEFGYVRESPVLDEEYDRALLVGSYRAESQIAAEKFRLLAKIHREKNTRGDLDTEWLADTIAAETGSSVGRVSNDLALALQLTETLPVTLELLAEAKLDLYRVRKIADAARALDADQCRELEEVLYPGVLGKTSQQFVRQVNRIIVTLDPDAAQKRRIKSRQDRHVRIEPEPLTGMGWLYAYLPADDLAAIGQGVDTLALTATSDNDDRTMDQLRADVLRDLLLNSAHKTAGGTAATIYVTVSAETLFGLDNRAGELRGYGPITAEHARDLAYRLHSEWVGVLVDDDGRPVSIASKAYRFRGKLAELIRLRDTACTHPACDRPADRCDLDHLLPWPRGETALDNASTECRRHHRLKTLTDWTVTRNDHQVTWTDPAGRTHTKPTEPITSGDHTKSRLSAANDPPPF